MAVSKKTTLVEFNQFASTDRLWVVDNEADARFLADRVERGVIVSLDNGIESWTAGKGIGNWKEALEGFKGSVIFAFTPYMMAQGKVANYVKETIPVVKTLSPVTTLDIPSGEDLSEVIGDLDGAGIKALLGSGEVSTDIIATIGDGAKDIMYDIANQDFNFQQSLEGDAFITSKKGPAHIAIPFSHLGKYLVREYKNRFKTVASPQERNSTVNTIEADCAFAPPAVLGVRTATSPSTGTQWIDLGREDGKVIKLTAEGWSVESKPDTDVFFRRTAAVKELPIATPCALGETFQALQSARRFANIPDAQWPLVVGWMVTHLINDDDHLTPLAFFLGGSQSGKTTISVLTKFLTEGIIGKGSNTGARDGDLELSMSEERIKTLNNISTIPEELSELLCQVYEGLEVTGRKIYSTELVTMGINCSVIANGVTVGRMKEDLKTRVMALDIDPKHGGTPWRGGKVEKSKTIDDEMRRIHPDALGALLTLASLAISHHDDFFETVKAEIFRLKGFATTLRTLDMVWSLEGQTVNEYKRLMDVVSEEAIEDPMFECIRSLAVMDRHFDSESQSWVLEIDLKTLMNRLNEQSWTKVLQDTYSGKSSSFASTNSVRDAITRKSTDWKRMGVTYENVGRKRVSGTDNKQTFYKFTFKHSPDTAWSQKPNSLMIEA